MIETYEMSKNFKNNVVLKEISFSIKQGEVFGLLGPNGAGKTTLIRCLLGIFKLSKGSGRIFGFDIKNEIEQIRKKTSLLPQEGNCVEYLTALENVIYFGGIHSGDILSSKELETGAKKYLKKVGLSDHQNSLSKTFSEGMKKRLLVACSLVTNSDLIFLDEPTTGIDIIGAQNLRSLIRNLKKNENKTIFLTTHDLTDIHELCDRIGIIFKRKIRAIGTLEELERKFQVEGIENVYRNIVEPKFTNVNVEGSF
ncbi:MAG: ABC transporter ATP-binding protein [Candidatus Hodarchaeales archaeon]